MTRSAALLYGNPAWGTATVRHPDRGLMVRGSLGLVERGSDAGEQRASVVASQHAGEHTDAIGLALLEEAAALGDSNQSAVSGIGHPHRTFRVQADPVGRHGELAERFAKVRRRRRIAEGRPRPAIAE